MKKKTSTPVWQDSTAPVPERVRDLLQQMTVAEKLAQLSSRYSIELLDRQRPSDEKLQSLLAQGIGQITRIAGASTLAPVEAAKMGNAIQRFLREKTRLGIPAILHEECCFGYLGLGGTVFPQMLGLASTWNPPLAERMTDTIRTQMLAVGARQGLAPVLDIAVDPRWGRTEETFGEDPLLVAQFGMAYVRGLQGPDRVKGVLATGKHFVAHSAPLGGMNCDPVHLGPRALWETFLLPYQAVISECGLATIMNAYNELDGELAAASRKILTDLLRGKLGFRGLVVSDYNAISMLHAYHRAAVDLRSAAVLSFRAGIDQELPSVECYGGLLLEAVEAGEIPMEDIEMSVGRVLQAKFELGLFENPLVEEGAVLEVFDTPVQRALAREAARESIVLLKNDGTLPLAAPRTIAVIGPNADEPRHMVGDYSYAAMLDLAIHSPMPGSPALEGIDQEHVRAHSTRIPSVLEGLRAAAPQGTEVLYARGCPVLDADRSGFDEAVQLAARADVVILVLGDKSGLTPGCTSGETRDRADLTLPGVQEDLAQAVIAAGKPAVAVLMNGRPVSSPRLQEHAAAIVEAWMPGEEGAAAIADVLFGRYNPAGRLPVTVARTVGQLPMQYNHKPSGGRSNWYGEYVDQTVSPLYPFGHGLSYTTFEYSDLRIDASGAKAGGDVPVSFVLKNSGNVAGEEVAQLYICDLYASIPRPVKELKGFCRVKLQPGESKKLNFRFPVNLLAFYDTNLELVVEPGAVQVMIGASSEDIRLKGEFNIAGGKTTVSKRLFTCPVTLE